MNDITINTTDAVLELLEAEACAINMTGLVQLLADHPESEIKRLTNDLYMQGKINRVQIMGAKGRYYGFYALSVRTGRETAAQPLEQQVVPAPLPVALSPDEAVEVLERAGWTAEPEVVELTTAHQVARRTTDRRRLTALEVIKRWRLAYPLARVVEIIGDARKSGVSRADAALAIRMIREHVRGEE